MTPNKPLTPAQFRALKIVHAQAVERGSYHRGQPSMQQRDFIRGDVLMKLKDKGYIDSRPPFAFTFHSVVLTDKGRSALRHGR